MKSEAEINAMLELGNSGDFNAGKLHFSDTALNISNLSSIHASGNLSLYAGSIYCEGGEIHAGGTLLLHAAKHLKIRCAELANKGEIHAPKILEIKASKITNQLEQPQQDREASSGKWPSMG